MSRNAEVVTRPERRYRFVIDIASLRGLGMDSRRHGRGQRRHDRGPRLENPRCGIHFALKELQLSALLVAITRPEVCGADSASRDADEDRLWFERDAVLGGFDVYMLRLHGKPLRMNHAYALCVPAVKDVRSVTRSPAPLPVSSAAHGMAVSYFGVAVRSSNWMIESALVHTPNLPASLNVPSWSSMTFLPSKKTWMWSPTISIARSCQTPDVTLPFQPANRSRRPFTTWYRWTLSSSAFARVT